MKKIIISFFFLTMLVVNNPVSAVEQLMTKLFFDNWLKNATLPLDQSIIQLSEKYKLMERDIKELQEKIKTEIRVTIGRKTAYVNGRTVSLDVPPVVVNGRTMVPVRFVGEAFGASFSWDNAQRKATYQYGDLTIEIYADKKTAMINGKSISLDTAPVIIEGRTMVPLRFVGEHMGASVEWDDRSSTAIIHG
jgi:hypothetical protein